MEDQIVVALTTAQSEMVRSLVYQERGRIDDPKQCDFLDVLADQFEQAEDEA